jgi:murein L,D-transpeptidase YcbB/YkuD
LSCLFLAGDSIVQLRRINKPVLLTLQDDAGAEHQVIMTGLDYDEAEVTIGDRSHRVSVVDLTHRWYGEHLLLWRPAAVQNRGLTPGSIDDGVAWLRDSLAKIRGVPNPDPESRVYDQTLEAWVRDYQRERHLTVDGIAGARTQIAIMGELQSDDEPSLYRVN